MSKSKLSLEIHNNIEDLIMYHGKINHFQKQIKQLWEKYHNLTDGTHTLLELIQLDADVKNVVLADAKLSESFLLIENLKSI